MGHAQVNRSGPCLVQEPIYGNESLSRGEFRRKAAIGRKTASETPREKEGLANGMKMRQAANMVAGHNRRVCVFPGEFSGKTAGRLTIGRRFPTCPTNRLRDCNLMEL